MADRLPGAEPEKVNPYVQMLSEDLDQGPSLREAPEPSLVDRLRVNFEAGKRESLFGAGEALVYNRDRELDSSIPGDVESRRRGERILEDNERFEAFPSSDTPLEYLAAGAGFIGGMATSPETFAAMPTRFVLGGASALTRMFRAGVSGAAINTAIDPGVQAMRIEAGLQDTYSPLQTALATVAGFALPSAAQGLIEGGRALTAKGAARQADEIAPDVSGAPDLDAEIGAEARASLQDVVPELETPPAATDIAPEVREALPEEGTPAPAAVPGALENVLGRFRSMQTADDVVATGTQPSSSPFILPDGRIVNTEDHIELAEALGFHDIAPAQITTGVIRTGGLRPSRSGGVEFSVSLIRGQTVTAQQRRAITKMARAADEVFFDIADETGHVTLRTGQDARDLTRALSEFPQRPPETVTPEPQNVTAATAREPVSAGSEPGTVTTPGQPLPEFTPDLPATPGQRAGLFLFNPADLEVDAGTFQFKGGGDAEGVTPILRGVTRWDPDAAGQVIVWQRGDGELIVADGHQRTGLARRMMEAGQDEIQLPGILYREADGFSADDVRLIAALKNIKEGSGDVVDAARVLRDAPERADEIAEISRAQTRAAADLAQASPRVWLMAVNDVIDARFAALVGRILKGDEAAQDAAANLLAKVNPSTPDEAEILIRRVREGIRDQKDAEAQGVMFGGSNGPGGLFGDIDGPQSAVAEELKIVSRAAKLLSKDRNMLKRVAANAERIEETGSQIARDTVTKEVDEAGTLMAHLETLARTKGPVRDRLLKAAKELKDGRISIGDAVQAYVDAVRGAQKLSDRRGPESGGRGRVDANERQVQDSEVDAFAGNLRGQPLTGAPGRSKAGVAQGLTPQAQRLKDISDRLVETLGITVRQGRITARRALGTFNRRSGAVRLKELDNFDVLAHEGGHALHLRPDNKKAVDALIKPHAQEVEALAYAGTPQGKEKTEGFAEFFRLYVTNPLNAEKSAPNFHAKFDGWLKAERPGIHDGLRQAQDAYRDWLQAPSKDLLTGDLVTSAAPPITTRVGRAMESDRLPRGGSLFSLFDRFYTWTIDSLHPVNKAVQALAKIHKFNTGKTLELKAPDDTYKLLRLATSAHQEGHMDLIYGVHPYRGLDPEGPSIGEALELAVGKNWYGNWRSDELMDFGGYLVARRSVQEFQRFLAGEVPNPPGKLTLGDYKQAIADYERMHPNYAQAAALVYEWQSRLLKKKLDAGLVSRTYYDTSLQRSDYVPFMRDFAETAEEMIAAGGTRGNNRQSVMKAYRGSLRSIINPIESMVADAYNTAAVIAKNDAIRALAQLARKAGPDAAAIAEEIPARQLKPMRVDLEEAIKAAGRDVGMGPNDPDIGILMQQAEDVLGADNLFATLYRAGDAPEKGEPIVYYWEGGERKAIRLADGRFGRELYEAITLHGKEQSNWIIDMLAVPARVLRTGITTSFDFIGANVIRDQVSAFILNRGVVPFVSAGRGIADELAQSRTARLYSRAGGIMGGANVASLDQARIGREVRALQKNGYKIRRFATLRGFLQATEVSETATRLGLFRSYFQAAKKSGATDHEAMLEAAFQARDYIDFGRAGSKMLFARKVVTFLNAALQGTDKTGRVLFGDLRPMAKVYRGEALTAAERANIGRSVSAWTKLGTIAALSAVYTSLMADDEEYQAFSEYYRSTHWLFPIPGEGGGWAAIPKPFELAVPMNLAERVTEGIMEEDPTWSAKWLRSFGYTVVPPTDAPGLMTPLEAFVFNYDTFRDRQIVPHHMQGYEPWLQFNAYTSELSKELGGAINVSPAKIDHMIVGWSGSWGRNILAATDAMTNERKRGEAAYDWPITQRFVKSAARGSAPATEFWNLVSQTGGRLAQKSTTFKHLEKSGDEAGMREYFNSLRDDEKVWVALNQLEAKDKRLHPLRRASDQMSVYSTLRRELTNDNVRSVITDEPIVLPPDKAWQVNDTLARLAMIEARNALIVAEEPGWAGRKIMDPSDYFETLRTVSPELATEIEDRSRKAKVYPFEGVRAVWPDLKQRMLDEGLEAFVGDLRAEAIYR